MQTRLVSLVALAVLAGAQGARELARSEAATTGEAEPYTPSPAAAPYVSLGYREVAADLLFFRLVGYFGGKHTAEGVAALVEAIAALDPRYRKIYMWGARAMSHALGTGLGREHHLRAIRLLEAGMREFPEDYQMPELAGAIYLVDLITKDPVQRRAWDEAGTKLLERAVRTPGAPATLGTWIAQLRTKLGQTQRAKDELRELILITDDTKAREELLAKLGELEQVDSAEIAIEIFEARRRFERAWRKERPFMPPSLYLLVGPPRPPGFDMTDLATGGIDLVGSDFTERLDPL
ncbi:MAG: hypothetical protein H0V17_06920 [Deltaproteobacteria bacterium]|nr:hypothetical protein [Deltaproteobacteria bacterium]